MLLLEPNRLIYARPEKAHLHSIDIPYSTRASREIIAKADSAADGTYSFEFIKQGTQFRLELHYHRLEMHYYWV